MEGSLESATKRPCIEESPDIPNCKNAKLSGVEAESDTNGLPESGLISQKTTEHSFGDTPMATSTEPLSVDTPVATSMEPTCVDTPVTSSTEPAYVDTPNATLSAPNCDTEYVSEWANENTGFVSPRTSEKKTENKDPDLRADSTPVTEALDLDNEGSDNNDEETAREVEEEPVDKETVETTEQKDTIIQSDNHSKTRQKGSRIEQLADKLRSKERLRKRTEALRNEETKLILLQKLRFSVTHPSASSKKADDALDMSSKQRTSSPVIQLGHSNQHKVLNSMPALQTTSSSSRQQHYPQQSHTIHHQSATANGHVPPPLVNMNHRQLGHSLLGHGSTHRERDRERDHHKSNANGTPSSTTPKPATTVKESPVKISADQKRHAVKSGLRRQLEKSLLQIPRSRMPPPEVNFIPSLAGAEFVCLVGMEEIVKRLLSPEQKDVKYVFNPFSCVQCKTDYTPVWKRDKPGSKNVICEACLTSNQKRAMRREHTSKLKAVFTDALRNEQEIERRIAAGSPLTDVPAVAALVQTANNKAAAAAAASAASQAASKPAMPQLTPRNQYKASSSSASVSSQQVSSSKLTQSQLQQHQQQQMILQAQEQMRAMLAAQALAYPQLQQFYGLGGNNQSTVDLMGQRQYLLDMISNPQNALRGWKS